MVKCWCGNSVFERYSEHYHRCTACHTLISDQEFHDDIVMVQDEQDDLYGSNYWKEQMLKTSGEKSLDDLIDRYLSERVLYWIKTTMKYILPGTRSLELGCGLGQYSYMMQQAGYCQTAMELSPEIVAFIRDCLRVDAVQGTAAQINGSYDTIQVFDVLEHVTDPVAFLRNMADHLTEQGILCIQTPCYDETLDYAEMQANKPRFESLMVEDEHIYLFSRESVTRLLAECGFPYVQFEPAFFGDDYDMFLFASKQPIKCHTEEEIGEALNSQPNGRMIKAMLRLFDEKQQAVESGERHRIDAEARLQQTEQLDQWLREREADCQLRWEQIQELEKLLQTSEEDRAARLTSIQELEKLLQTSEEDRAARLAAIQELEARLAESEADRAARLDVINELQARLAESEADRAARLVRIQELDVQLQQLSK